MPAIAESGARHFHDPGQNLGPKANDLWTPVIVAVNGMACCSAFYMLGVVEFVIAAEHATFFDPHLTMAWCRPSSRWSRKGKAAASAAPGINDGSSDACSRPSACDELTVDYIRSMVSCSSKEPGPRTRHPMGDDVLVVSGPDAGVVTLTLNRPEKRNALSVALRDAISDALDALAGREDVKVVVLTGRGDVFSAGFDLREFERLGSDPDFEPVLWASSDRFHRAVLDFPLPLVAAVNGPALAGGFDLAVMCDLRVAADTARFAHPELSFIEVIYSPLHDLVGGAVARELCLTGRSVEAEEARQLRLVSSVVTRAELMAEARSTALDVARAPREVLVRMKRKIARRAAIAAELTRDL